MEKIPPKIRSEQKRIVTDWLRRLSERSEWERVELLLHDADRGSAERFCQATEPPRSFDPRALTEAYLLERFDNVAGAFLQCVNDRNDLVGYEAVLREWCVSGLPDLERHYTPRIAKALRLPIFRSIRKKFGTEKGRITGTVDRVKLAKRIYHWQRRASRRLIRLVKSGVQAGHNRDGVAATALSPAPLRAREVLQADDLINQLNIDVEKLVGAPGIGELKPDPEPRETQNPATRVDVLQERRELYALYTRACREKPVEMTEAKLAKLANPRWNTRDPVTKWKAGKDREGDDARIRRAIAKGPPAAN